MGLSRSFAVLNKADGIAGGVLNRSVLLGTRVWLLFLNGAANFDPPSPHSDVRTDSAQGATGVYPLSIGNHCS